MQDHQPLLDSFPSFTRMIQVPYVGNSEGLAILWDDAVFELDDISTIEQEIHAMVKLFQMDMVMKLGATNAVVIFTKSSCCISHSIETLIRSFGANPTIYELDTHPNGKQMEKALIELGCQPSVPAIFIGKELVGGANEIMSLNVRGKLKQLLIRANAIWV
ncbi:monothiol glutaredoxin-S1-like [Solanum verrucosum]|nr:monothiol glutaredoxin-S1-like [Solanum verrucosum]